MNKNGYEILSKFKCYGKNMVTVKFGNSVHVMTEEDLRRIHRKQWKLRVA